MNELGLARNRTGCRSGRERPADDDTDPADTVDEETASANRLTRPRSSPRSRSPRRPTSPSPPLRTVRKPLPRFKMVAYTGGAMRRGLAAPRS